MTRSELLSLVVGVLLGNILCLFVQYCGAVIFCWHRRRKAQREAKRLAEIRIAEERQRQSELLTTIQRLEQEVKLEDAYAQARPSETSGPFAVDASDDREMCLVFRTALIELRSKDRRRFFPLTFGGGTN